MSAAAAYNARQAVIQEAEELKPKSTKDAYKPKQEEFKGWCRAKFAQEQAPETVCEDKLLMFLRECVVGRERKRKRNDEATTQRSGQATYNSNGYETIGSVNQETRVDLSAVTQQEFAADDPVSVLDHSSRYRSHRGHSICGLATVGGWC